MDITEKDIINFSEKFNLIESEIKKGIIGQRSVIRNVLICMIAGGNVLLEGLPGLGKTELVKTIGHVLDLKFQRIQFTPDLMPADVTGTDILVKSETGQSSFSFQPGPIFSNIVLADEINRATPKTQSAMLEAMQEKTVTVGGKTYPLKAPFFVLATQNPLEMEGTFPLPEAQMDRFMMKLNIEFPNQEDIVSILDLTTGSEKPVINKMGSPEEVIFMHNLSRLTPVSKSVSEFVANLIYTTHPESGVDIVKKYVRYGSSPRGAQSLILAGKIKALLEGRYNIAFDDIRELAAPVLRHRLFLNFEALSDGITSDDVIKELIK